MFKSFLLKYRFAYKSKNTLSSPVPPPPPGSPLLLPVVDSLAIAVDWESVRLVPVGVPFLLDLDPRGSPDASVTARVQGNITMTTGFLF